MLQFIFKNKEDMIKRINNGEVQNDIYNYFAELTYDNTYYPDMCNSKLTKETAFEAFDYFDAQFDDFFISDNEIANSSNEIASTLHNVISNVYERFEQEIETVKKSNAIKLALVLYQEDAGFFSESYDMDLLEKKDKDEIVKIAIEFYRKIEKLNI